MKRLAVLILLALIPAAQSLAVGISIDAGITPPEGRWILRTQVRSMSRTTPETMTDGSMDRLMVPLVVVHGLRPQLTLGLRQIIDSRSMTMMGNETTDSGLSDLYLFAKYKILRINTRNYTLGIAPLLGVEAPTGSNGITSDYWSLNTGLLVSGRAGKWGADLNLSLGLRGIANTPTDDFEPGNKLGLDLALARQIPVGSSGRVSLAPVLEISWQDSASDAAAGIETANSGESVFSLAPGLKYTRGDLILEGLVRIPVSQEQEGMQMEIGTMYLLGIRHMF